MAANDSDDAKKAAVFDCIVVTFGQQGFPEVTNPQERVVWSSMDDSVIVLLGNEVTNCITAKGFNVPALAPVFSTLKEEDQVTVVSDLVAGIAGLVMP